MASAIGIGRFIYTPILPPMAEGLHLTKGEAGLIAAANFIGYLIGALAATSPRGRTNPRVWLLAALAVERGNDGDHGLVARDVGVSGLALHRRHCQRLRAGAGVGPRPGTLERDGPRQPVRNPFLGRRHRHRRFPRC